MKQRIGNTINLSLCQLFSGTGVRAIAILTIGLAAMVFLNGIAAQVAIPADTLPPSPFKVGEKLTYGINYGRFKNVGVAEMYTVSRGKLDGRDAVELRARVKTSELVSAAFFMVDEARTTFAAADSGLPLYLLKTTSSGVSPVETNTSFLSTPAQNYDLLTMIYRFRSLGGAGTLVFQEGDRTFSVTVQPTVSEKSKTDVGEFETMVSTVQSDYLTELGLKDFRVNLTTDERRIPVRIRFKTAKGEFEMLLASLQSINPEGETPVTKTPTPTPIAVPTPTPVATPTPSRDNQPLSVTLPFVLGETLDYRITTAGAAVGTFRMKAESRRLIEKRDVLTLKATVTGAERGFDLFAANDFVTAQVNAESLAPFQFDVRFTGGLSSFNQVVRFDQQRGFALIGQSDQIQIPVHTHSLLSLAYAIRSFNLKPSKDSKNPVNDTRVAVLYDSQFYIFTIRSLGVELIAFRKEMVSVQQVTVITGNPQLDSLGIKVWLANDEKRTPIRFLIGKYQADLVNETTEAPK